ncbi:MAG: AAA family ATPase [Pelatocladus maniniholoensis HA4357-MV3]|uniref:AAA family ATPase n=1 Tax=Pelatocladus maniniholoensis HA4357-MV3 TaxID=1117104 RepID=A0A9E3HCX7_9NOST|nr:AAA family ATPase [Pelatocladus maniniholoensis HA4357-MV3]BAZ70730.1 ATPase central domain-containing protein [Fischerella sp. NIES-4106]
MAYYPTSIEHILAELERIDLLIRVQIWRMQHIQTGDNELQGLLISEQEIEQLLTKPIGLPRWANVPTPLSSIEVQTALKRMTANIAQCQTESIQKSIKLRLHELVCHFQLTPIDRDTLLICLAPELDSGYERLYAYLQDDVRKKRPSVDLVLNLLCADFKSKLTTRQNFLSTAPLLKHQLLHLFDDSSQQQVPLLSKYLKLDERVVNYLLGSDELDTRLLPYAKCTWPQTKLEDLLLPLEIKERLGLLAQEKQVIKTGLIFYFQGTYGVGKHTTAEAFCQELGIGLLTVELERLLQAEAEEFETIMALACREAVLQSAAIYWEDFDRLLTDGKATWRLALLRQVQEMHLLTFLAGDTTWEPSNVQSELTFLRVEFLLPTAAQRVELWAKFVGEDIASLPDLANKFRFSGGQIRDAAATARNLACWRYPTQGQVTINNLYAACRLQSNRQLSAMARKITPRYKWSDIILPDQQEGIIQELCNYVKYRSRVYDEWGFEKKLSLGKGLNILFAGPPGTGKTMAAEVVAGELELDLYKIDLSAVVSKYIGETEKHLSRIFQEAETSNAILFFDEADALFGKRTEVSDAHDRYANLEVSYLLQRMEEYDGVVILATNFRKNMDEAFVRRLHFSIDFPLPDEKHRRRIWQKLWPEATPRSADLDLDFMARRFEIAGGNIRNIALAAAFLAADEGGEVKMSHLVRATRREYQKMGKVLMNGEFGEYAGQL